MEAERLSQGSGGFKGGLKDLGNLPLRESSSSLLRACLEERLPLGAVSLGAYSSARYKEERGYSGKSRLRKERRDKNFLL